jgi:hypothetical protein
MVGTKVAARAFLFSKMSEDMHDIVSHVDDRASPEPAWSLVEHFIGTSQVELGHMRRELYALRMDDQTTLTKFIERITFYTDEVYCAR